MTATLLILAGRSSRSSPAASPWPWWRWAWRSPSGPPGCSSSARRGLGAAEVRNAAAAFARAVPQDARLATRVPVGAGLSAHDAAAAIVEGVLLARYRFSLASRPDASAPVPVRSLVLVAPEGEHESVAAGARRGLATARAACLGRDLAACPAGLLTATEGPARRASRRRLDLFASEAVVATEPG